MSSVKLAQVKVEVPEVTQSEVGQKQKLHVVLDMVNKILQLPPGWKHQKWNVDSQCSQPLSDGNLDEHCP